MHWASRTGAKRKLFAIKAPVWTVTPVLSVSQDGSQAFWQQNDNMGANLCMIENFH